MGRTRAEDFCSIAQFLFSIFPELEADLGKERVNNQQLTADLKHREQELKDSHEVSSFLVNTFCFFVFVILNFLVLIYAWNWCMKFVKIV